MTKFEDVCEMTTEEYFNGNQFSIDAFNKKYTKTQGESYVKALKRVCDYMASAEKSDEQRKYWSDRWFDEIFNDWWHPAGSIMQGAESGKKISMSNCTTISLGAIDSGTEWDNLESIFKNTAYTVAKTAAYRQGLGLDFSRIRPENSTICNSSKSSQGVVHWMKLIDSLGNFIGQAGRIPAMLMSLDISHPDVEKFIKLKSDYTKIQNANISVQITDDFMKAVKNNEKWMLHFDIPEINIGQKVYIDVHSTDVSSQRDNHGWYYVAAKHRPAEHIEKLVDAVQLLQLVAKCMTDHAEPGVQFIDMARHWSNSDYVYDPESKYDSRIISTNACCVVGETKIKTNKGEIEIAELFTRINSGEKIMAMSFNVEKGVFELKEILAAFQQRNDATVSLSVEENGSIYEIECSSDHPILTKNRGYVQATSLREDDDIVLFNMKA